MNMSLSMAPVRKYFAGRSRDVLIAACVLVAIMGIVTYVAVSRGPHPGESIKQQITELEKAVKADPHNADGRVALAITYYQAGERQQAISQLKTALKFNDSHQGALLLLGDIYMVLGQYQDAIPNYQKVVSLNPIGQLQFPSAQVEGAYYQLGAAYFNTNSFSDAAKTLEGALIIDGSDADAWLLLGKTYQQTGELEKSIECFKKAVNYVPNYSEAYQLMAQSYERLGQTTYAEYARAMVAYSAGSAQEAVTQLEKVVAEKPDFADAYLGLALAYEKVGMPDKATSAYQKVLGIDPENWLALAKLGK